MPMRLIVRTAALVVTSGIAVTALLAGPHGGIPAWGTGLVLSIVLLAVAAGAALDVAEWKDVQRGGLPRAAARHARTAVCTPPRGAAAAAVAATGGRAGRRRRRCGRCGSASPCSTRRRATCWPRRSRASAPRPREAMSRDRARRMAGAVFGVRRVADQAAGGDDRRNRLPRTRRRRRRGASSGFSGCSRTPPVEVKSVSRVEDRLFQDNDVSGWVVSNRTGTAWTVADLEHATIRVKAVYLSFDDEDFRQPPRFETLHLCFGEPARGACSPSPRPSWPPRPSARTRRR